MTTQMNFGPEWMRRSREVVPSSVTTNNDKSSDDNYIKYSKEYMLNLYNEQSANIPVNIKHDKYAVMSESQSPFLLLSLDDYQEEKGTTGTSFINDRKNLHGRVSSSKDEPLWGGVDLTNVGSFDRNGIFHSNSSASFFPAETSLGDETNNKAARFFDHGNNNNGVISKSDMNTTFINKSTAPKETQQVTTTNWVYRDPFGKIQGPFTSMEMQDWYEAGFFEDSLQVKRLDGNNSSNFEPLIYLIAKLKNNKTPFLTPWPASSNSNSSSSREKASLSIDGQQQPTCNDGFLFNRKPTLEGLILPLQDNTTAFSNNGQHVATPQPAQFTNGPFSNHRVNPVNNRASLNMWNNNNVLWSNNSTSTSSLFDSGNVQHQQQETLFYGNSSNSNAPEPVNQQYLAMLRQTQQQHLQLQSRVLQQQQQQILAAQQQQNQQQYQQHQQQLQLKLQQDTLLNNNNSNRAMAAQQQENLRGWSSVPGTPSFLEPNFSSIWGTSQFVSQVPFLPMPTATDDTKTELSFPIENMTVNDHLTEKMMNMTIVKPLSPPEQSQQQQPGKEEMLWKNKTVHLNQPPVTSSGTTKTTISKFTPSMSLSYSTTTTISGNTTNTTSSTSKGIPISKQKHVSMSASIPSPATKSRANTFDTINTTPPQNNTQHTTSDTLSIMEPKNPSQAFIEWCKFSLRDLNASVNVDEILQMLLSFPVDNTSNSSEIIQDIIYANSSSMDGRRFAKDFYSLRKADMEGKEIVIPSTSNLFHKKGTEDEFKVVVKKGKKKQQLHLQ